MLLMLEYLNEIRGQAFYIRQALIGSDLRPSAKLRIAKLLKLDVNKREFPNSWYATEDELREFNEGHTTWVPSELDDQLNLDSDNLTNKEYCQALVEELLDLASA